MKKDIFDKLNLMFNKLRWNGVSLIGFLIAFVCLFGRLLFACFHCRLQFCT
jgi:hypothetical protein